MFAILNKPLYTIGERVLFAAERDGEHITLTGTIYGLNAVRLPRFECQGRAVYQYQILEEDESASGDRIDAERFHAPLEYNILEDVPTP